MELTAAGPARYRTLFLSDLHLGMRNCQGSRVLDFLRRTESDRLYLVGDFARPYAGLALHVGGIEIRRKALHETADGRRLLVLHGDEFDGVVRYARWLSRLGARAYEASLALNTVLAAIRERMGYPYWSLAAFLKARAKKAGHFEQRCNALDAARAGAGLAGLTLDLDDFLDYLPTHTADPAPFRAWVETGEARVLHALEEAAGQEVRRAA